MSVIPRAGHATWTESLLYDLTNGTDGCSPSGLAIDAAGALYGVTDGGKGAGCYGACGTVFRLPPPAQQGAVWSYTLLHTFTGNPDGSDPFGVTLDSDGNLHGNTHYGGIESPGTCSVGCGTIFKLTKPAPGQPT